MLKKSPFFSESCNIVQPQSILHCTLLHNPYFNLFLNFIELTVITKIAMKMRGRV